MTPRKIKNLPESTSGFPDTSVHEIKAESNPFTSADMRMLAYAWAGMAVRVFLILGGIFSVWQYLQQREEKRVERTLDLVQLWEQPTYQQAQRAVRDRLEALNARHANLIGDNPTAKELAIYSQRLGMAAMSADGGEMPLSDFREEFGRIVYFLNRVSFCVEGNLCSAKVADAFFRDYAQSFWNYFSDYIEGQRSKGQPKFGEAIESYVKRGG